MSNSSNPARAALPPRAQSASTAGPEGAAADDQDGRSAVFRQIKKALVTSRLTLAGQDAGSNPYDSRSGRGPGAVWRGRSRF